MSTFTRAVRPSRLSTSASTTLSAAIAAAEALLAVVNMEVLHVAAFRGGGARRKDGSVVRLLVSYSTLAPISRHLTGLKRMVPVAKCLSRLGIAAT